MGGNGGAEPSQIVASVTGQRNGTSATLLHVRVESELRRVTDIGGDGRPTRRSCYVSRTQRAACRIRPGTNC